MTNETRREYTALFHELESYNNELSGKLAEVKKVNGWIEQAPNDTPYNGVGSLVYFKYKNVYDNTKVYYYILTDNEVVALYQFILTKVVRRTYTVHRSFDEYTTEPLAQKMNLRNNEQNDWWVEVYIKEHYGEMDDNKRDFSHLNTSGGLTEENLYKDIDNIETRGINFCQFIAEQCMLALDQEKRVA